MKIWKFPIEDSDVQTIKMPEGAEILTVQVQSNVPQLWAICDESANKEERKFAIYETGSSIPESPGKYIATFQMRNGGLVLHIFEVAA